MRLKILHYNTNLQETESRPHERLKQSPLQSKIRITPPLKQFDMRLPDIEHEPKYDYYGSVKQRRLAEIKMIGLSDAIYH